MFFKQILRIFRTCCVGPRRFFRMQVYAQFVSPPALQAVNRESYRQIEFAWLILNQSCKRYSARTLNFTCEFDRVAKIAAMVSARQLRFEKMRWPRKSEPWRQKMNVIHEGDEYCGSNDGLGGRRFAFVDQNFNSQSQSQPQPLSQLQRHETRSPASTKIGPDENFNDSNGNTVNVIALLQSLCHTSASENHLRSNGLRGHHQCTNNINLNGVAKARNNCNCYLHLLLLQVRLRTIS